MFPLPTIPNAISYPIPTYATQGVTYPHYLFTYGDSVTQRSIYLYIGGTYAVCFNGSDGFEYTTLKLKDVSYLSLMGIHPRTEERLSIAQKEIVFIDNFFEGNTMKDDNDIVLYYGDKVRLQTLDAPLPSGHIIFEGVQDNTANFIVSKYVKFSTLLNLINEIQLVTRS